MRGSRLKAAARPISTATGSWRAAIQARRAVTSAAAPPAWRPAVGDRAESARRGPPGRSADPDRGQNIANQSQPPPGRTGPRCGRHHLRQAEWVCGTAVGADDFVLVWMGVGLGLAIVLAGRLYRGAAGAAGEIGAPRWPTGGGWSAPDLHGLPAGRVGRSQRPPGAARSDPGRCRSGPQRAARLRGWSLKDQSITDDPCPSRPPGSGAVQVKRRTSGTAPGDALPVIQLTPQETQIVRLAADGQSQFRDCRPAVQRRSHCKYLLRKIFTKFGIPHAIGSAERCREPQPPSHRKVFARSRSEWLSRR